MDDARKMSLLKFIEGAKLRSAWYADEGLDRLEQDVCELMFRRSAFRRYKLIGEADELEMLKPEL